MQACTYITQTERNSRGERNAPYGWKCLQGIFFAFCGFGGNSQTLHLLKFLAHAIWIYVSGFEKRYNFMQIGNFELVVCFESTVNELHVLHFASLAASIAEICLLKVQNYTRCVFA